MIIRRILSFILLTMIACSVMAMDINNGNKRSINFQDIIDGDPKGDVIAAISDNDLRFIGYYRGRYLVIPGVNDFARLYMSKYGLKIIKDVDLYLDEDPESEINKRLYNYVNKYNMLLLEHVNKK
jgi:hypothetical protein